MQATVVQTDNLAAQVESDCRPDAAAVLVFHRTEWHEQLLDIRYGQARPCEVHTQIRTGISQAESHHRRRILRRESSGAREERPQGMLYQSFVAEDCDVFVDPDRESLIWKRRGHVFQPALHERRLVTRTWIE